MNDSYKNVSRISSLLGKIVIFLYTGKIIQVLDFNNWHPLNYMIPASNRDPLSSEHINEKGDEPYHGFGYISLVSNPLDLTTWSQRESL